MLGTRRAAIATAAAAAIAVTAAAASPAVAETAENPTTVRVSLFSWPGYAFWFLASEKDLVPEVDLDITIIEDPYQSFALMEAGQLDVASSTAEYAPLAAAEGNSIRLVAYTNVSYGTDKIILAPGIESAADLAGETVAVLEGGLSQIFMAIWLEENGVSPDDVTFANLIMDDATAAMISGQVAAGAFWEPFGGAVLGALEGASVAAVSDTAEWTSSGLLADAMYMRQGFVEENPEAARLAMKAYFAAVDYWRANPDEANEIMARAIGFPLADVVSVIGADGGPAEGGLVVYGLEDSARFMGVLPGDPKLGALGQSNGAIRDHFALTAGWWERFGLVEEVPAFEAGVSLAPMEALAASGSAGR